MGFSQKYPYPNSKMIKNENREQEYPGDATDLEKKPDWKETTHPNQKGSREFQNKKTGEKIRYDYGKPGKPGHEGKDHYHRLKT